MAPRILTYELQQQYEALRALLQRSLWLAERCADYDATQILRARLANFQAPALLVIVGEVKTGKSSFINALLHEDVCEVAPGPCTTRIQELVYGPERSLTTLGDVWERVYLPKDVLREATIVDTPGTNSIIQDHPTITENYIPQSDLVVFVFSAVNPHTHSAWELLTLIKKDWHRKMVFVLQQADRASAEELATNREHVKQYARDRQVEDPIIFTLSAKLEIAGEVGSGFAGFRSYLRGAIEGGEVWRMKVEGSYQTIRTVMGKLLTSLRTENDAVAEERLYCQELVRKVEEREVKAGPLKQLVVAKLCATYDNLAHDSETAFAEGLGLRSLLGRALPFTGERDSTLWLGHLKTRFQEVAKCQLDAEARRLSKDLLGEVDAMIAELTQSLGERQARVRENVALPDTAARLKMIDGLRTRLQRISLGDEIVQSAPVDATSTVSRFAIAGGGLSILGLVVFALAHTLLIHLAGVFFVVAGIALLMSGLFWRRLEMVREFRDRLGDHRKQFQQRLEVEVGKAFEDMFFSVRQALTESVFRSDLRASRLEAPLKEAYEVGEASSELLSEFRRGVVPRIASYG